MSEKRRTRHSDWVHQFNLNFYRISFQAPELFTAAQELLKKSITVESLQHELSWQEKNEIEFLRMGFQPQANAKEILLLLKRIDQRAKYKEARIKSGFPDLLAPRKGLRGWWQSRKDRKEKSFPIALDAFQWFQHSYRLALLATLHDTLLSRVVTGEAHNVPLDEIMAIFHPLTEMVARKNGRSARRLVEALSSPLHQIDPHFLIEGVAGYIIYQTNRGFAYYEA